MIKSQPIHPFPARMAPEIALAECDQLPAGSVVLDPMCGSGTTIRTAMDSGLRAMGFDMDPLAVLMSKVATTVINVEEFLYKVHQIISEAQQLDADKVKLPWIDNDRETGEFINFWFAAPQRNQLRKLAFLINREEGDVGNALRIAFSRIIITKNMGASLARDTSHSRPHRVALKNNYDVFDGYLKSAGALAKRLPGTAVGSVYVDRGDARNLQSVNSLSVDLIITSPPYLNAIDYMRGHRMSLVWLGYRLADLRTVRGKSIGAERGPEVDKETQKLLRHANRISFLSQLTQRDKGFFERYLVDMFALMKELYRVLNNERKTVMVVGNSRLRGVFIKNTEAVRLAAEAAGFKFQTEVERNLPANRRYLPPPSSAKPSSLGLRMRTESILTFIKP